MIFRILKQYAFSVFTFIVTILILVIQFKMPDLVPDIIQHWIDTANPEQTGYVSSLNIFLAIYPWISIISFFTSILSAVLIFIRNKPKKFF